MVIDDPTTDSLLWVLGKLVRKMFDADWSELIQRGQKRYSYDKMIFIGAVLDFSDMLNSGTEIAGWPFVIPWQHQLDTYLMTDLDNGIPVGGFLNPFPLI
jgi:hypothetical protein